MAKNTRLTMGVEKHVVTKHIIRHSVFRIELKKDEKFLKIGSILDHLMYYHQLQKFM